MTFILQDSGEQIGTATMSKESIMLTYVGPKTTFMASGNRAAFITTNGFEPPLRMNAYGTLKAPWGKEAFLAAQQDPKTIIPFLKSAYEQVLREETVRAKEILKKPKSTTDLLYSAKEIERLLIRKLGDMVEVLSDPSTIARRETSKERYLRMLRISNS
jgi:hypothetical protein